MADEPDPPVGWLPPLAAGGKPPPRFDTPPPPRWPDPAAGGKPPPRFDTPPPPRWPDPAAVEPDREVAFQATPLPEPQPLARRNVAAVWALVIAILSLALLVMSFGLLFLVTLPGSMLAWALARRAKAQIEQGTTSLGEGQASAAIWIARIGVIAGVAAAVILIVLLLSGFDLEQFRDDLERELERQREDDRRGQPDEGVRALAGQLLAVWEAR